MQNQRGNGIVIGVVIDLDDPENIGRIKVKYPHLEDQISNWARLVTFMAGPERGAFFRPEVNEEVLVAFELGDARRPYILGGVWNKVDPPPPDGGQPTQNNWRFIKSRSGHTIKLDDTQGSEKIEIVDKDGTRSVIVDSAGQKIQIISESDDIEVSAKSGSVKIEALNIEVKASNNMKLEATTKMMLKSALIEINSTGPASMTGNPIKLN
ncbi:MAG: phage baseplate assembly protein V [Desulfobacterales bacterium]